VDPYHRGNPHQSHQNRSNPEALPEYSTGLSSLSSLSSLAPASSGRASEMDTVPDMGWATMRYRVNYGDTVARLAAKFDMAPGEFLELNGLSERDVLEVDTAILVSITMGGEEGADCPYKAITN